MEMNLVVLDPMTAVYDENQVHMILAVVLNTSLVYCFGAANKRNCCFYGEIKLHEWLQSTNTRLAFDIYRENNFAFEQTSIPSLLTTLILVNPRPEDRLWPKLAPKSW